MSGPGRRIDFIFLFLIFEKDSHRVEAKVVVGVFVQKVSLALELGGIGPKVVAFAQSDIFPCCVLQSVLNVLLDAKIDFAQNRPKNFRIFFGVVRNNVGSLVG